MHLTVLGVYSDAKIPQSYYYLKSNIREAISRLHFIAAESGSEDRSYFLTTPAEGILVPSRVLFNRVVIAIYCAR